MNVRCEYCGKHVYEIVEENFKGDIASSSILKGINGFDSPSPGDDIECPSCWMPLLNSIRDACEGLVVEYA